MEHISKLQSGFDQQKRSNTKRYNIPETGQAYNSATILANLAIEFNCKNTQMDKKIDNTTKDSLVHKFIVNGKQSMERIFDCDKFYSFIRYKMRNQNGGNMLHLMKESINSLRNKRCIVHSKTNLQKIKSLNAQCF